MEGGSVMARRKKTEPEPEPELMPSFSPRIMRRRLEAFQRGVHRLIAERGLNTQEEIQAFLEQHSTDGSLERMIDELDLMPEEEALELVSEAMECEDLDEMLDLLDAALEADPECIEALCLLARINCEEDSEALVDALEDIVKLGEEKLGAKMFEECRGQFWGLLETRPYMRARQELITALAICGRFEEAAAHGEAMLELNEDDNQGIRSELLVHYLLLGNLEGARALLKRYEEVTAVFAWAHVFERFLAGNLEEARSAMTEARRVNPYVKEYLTGKAALPDLLPAYSTPGDRSEAIGCAAMLGRVLLQRPELHTWLVNSLK